LLALSIGLSLPAANFTILSGRVVWVADGDSLTIAAADGQRYKVRLAGIDAPERGQSYSQQSRQHLKALCLGKSTEVLVFLNDRYERSVGDVYCEGKNAGEDMLSHGLAWVYRPHSDRHQHYSGLKISAQASGLGLWIDKSPMPPWEWRKQYKQRRAVP
jgi:endonuclease YncB( thermonuclease family)